jgi:hypothetical protein
MNENEYRLNKQLMEEIGKRKKEKVGVSTASMQS